MYMVLRMFASVSAIFDNCALIRRSAPTDVLHTLVHTFIATRIDYCNAVIRRRYTRSTSRRCATNHSMAERPHYANIARYTTLAVCDSAHNLQNWTDDIRLYRRKRTLVLSMYRSFPSRLPPGFARLTTLTLLCHILRLCVMVRAVSVSWHPRFGTRCCLMSRTLILVVNISSRALRFCYFFARLLMGGGSDNLV